jgi:uncharacterized membrane protein
MINRADLKRNLIIFGVIHVFLFLVLLPALAQLFYPGTGSLELYLAQQMRHGQIPYHDFASEYPPLALLSFLLPGLFFHTTVAYSWAFAAELMVFDLLAMLMIFDLASFLKISVRKALVIYTLLIVATGPILVCRYDILPAMLVLGAIWAFIKGKTKLAWATAALGFAAKLYPAIIVPFFIIYQLKNRQYGLLIKGGAVFILVLLIVHIPWVIIDAPGFWHSLTYHLERGLHSESTYGTALLAGQVLGMTRMEAALTYGSWNLISPLADSLAKISFFVSAFVLLVIYGLFAWRLQKNSEGSLITKMSEPSAVKILQYSALAVALFMLTNKVFSAQYLAWLCPLLPLVAGGRRYLVPALFVVAAALTQYVYPYNYIGFELGEAAPVFVLTVRNLLLILMAILIALSDRTKASPYQMPGTNALRSGG